MVQTKETLTEILKGNIVKMEFTTVKGGDCTKFATLQDTILPPRVVVESVDENDTMKKTPVDNPDILKFWSVEDSGWRSLRIANLKAITTLSEGEAVEFVAQEAQKRADAEELKQLGC